MSCNGDCGSCLHNNLLAKDKGTLSPVIDENLPKEIQEFTYSTQMSEPSVVFLGVTKRCNLSCPYCFVSQGNQDMTLETAKKGVEIAIKNAEKHSIENNYVERPLVIFFGGEPLLMYEKIIVPIVKEYSDRCDFSLTTNGVLLNEDVVDFLSKNNVEVLLSFDGIKQVQDNQRPGKGFSSYDAVIKNIPYFLFRFPKATMRATVTKESVPFMLDGYSLGKKLGFLSFFFCVNAFEEWDDKTAEEYYNQLERIGEDVYVNAMSTDTYDEVIKVGVINSALFDYNRALRGTKINNEVVRCGMGTTSFTVCPDGEITTCQEKLSNPTHIIGDVDNGIDKEEHQRFLMWYVQKFNELQCPNNCSPIIKMMCLSRQCPSRLEDLDFQLSTSICKSHKMQYRLAKRLRTLLNGSILPRLQMAFELKVKEEEQCL